MVLTQRQKNNFWNKVEKTDGCWNWKGHTNGGYGKVNLNCQVYAAHRIALVIDGQAVQPLKPERGAAGQIVMHTCDNRKCVRPSHLKVTTQKENMRDAMQKGRKWNGESKGILNGRAKLSESVVKALKWAFSREAYVDVYRLADTLGIDASNLYAIKNNKSWRHVNP